MAILNCKQCEIMGLCMSLVIHYWIGDVQDSQGVSASEMTYIVSGGALNSTHSLTFELNGPCVCVMCSILRLNGTRWRLKRKVSSTACWPSTRRSVSPLLKRWDIRGYASAISLNIYRVSRKTTRPKMANMTVPVLNICVWVKFGCNGASGYGHLSKTTRGHFYLTPCVLSLCSGGVV